MLRLLTLGGVAVVDNSGKDTGAAASQRRTLALLSVLAVAGPVGMSRDKLVALFWPEADSERGRHALTQALYSARRVLQCDDLFVASADVRLNDSHITTDVRDLESALTSDLERAVSLYKGPFLDGFYLPGSREFEQWCSTQRDRIEAKIARALEQLAVAASAKGDARQAADWWKRLATLRPLDSGIAVRLMEALIAVGDRAGALNYSSVHGKLLRNELGLEPDPAVVALGLTLREPVDRTDVAETVSPTKRATYVDSQVITSSKAAGVADEAGRETVDSAFIRDDGNTTVSPADGRVEVWVPQRRHAHRWRAVLLLGLAAALVVTGIGIGRLRRTPPPIQPLAQKQRVVVAPFRVAGASPSLGYLRDGIVELLSTRLADDSLAPSVDAGAVIGAWRAAGLAAEMDVPRDTVVRLAARLGAERVVVGGVIGTPTRLVVRATVLRVPDGAVVGQASVEGSADSITAVIDHLAARLLVAEAGEDERLGTRMTTALPALRAYLSGQTAFRRNDYSSSVRHYENALSRDSTFALAALRLAVAADHLGDAVRVRTGIGLAWAFRNELGLRDQALLRGYAGPRFPAPSFSREQFDDWHRLADLVPSAAESWFAFASRLFHDGAATGISSSGDPLKTALLRALAVDTANIRAAMLLTYVTSETDADLATSAARRIALNDSLNPFAPFLRWRIAAVQSDSAAIRSFRGQLESLGPANLRQVALASQFDAIDLQSGSRALDILRKRSGARSRSADLLLAAHALAMNEGRPGDALQATRDLRGFAPTSHAGLRLRVLDALYGDGDTSAARAAVQELDSSTIMSSPQAPSPSDTRLADMCVIGQWQLANGIASTVPAIISQLRDAGARFLIAPVSASPAACAELLDAAAAIQGRGRDARARLARLDSLAFTVTTAGDAALYAPLWIARLHERIGDRSGALNAIRRRPYMTDWPRYLATMLREEGQWAETNQERSRALDAFRQYLALRHDPEPALVAQTAAVRQAIVRLLAVPAR